MNLLTLIEQAKRPCPGCGRRIYHRIIIRPGSRSIRRLVPRSRTKVCKGKDYHHFTVQVADMEQHRLILKEPKRMLNRTLLYGQPPVTAKELAYTLN